MTTNLHDTDAPLDRAIISLRNAAVRQGPPTELVARTLAAVQNKSNTIPLTERLTTMLWKTRYPGTAAAVLLIAALVGWFTLGGNSSVAFGQVLENIRKVRSGTCTAVMTIEGAPVPIPPQRTKIMFLEPGRVRWESEGQIVISDDRIHKTLILYPALKQAEILQADGPSANPAAQGYPFEYLKTVNEKYGKRVKDEKIDGKAAKVFRVQLPGSQKPGATSEMIVAVDSATALPIRIETISEVGAVSGRAVTGDFQWDVPLDESLFSTAAPEGYEVTLTRVVDPNRPTEADLIRSLKVGAENMEGRFPDQFVDDKGKPGPRFEGEAVVGVGVHGSVKPTEYGIALPGLMFAMRAAHFGEWHYAGKGVKLGEAEKVVAWWKATKDAKTYRVLYGDLTVKGVKPQDLPKAD